MAEQANPPSPQVYARIGGALYLFIIVAGIFGELVVRGRLIASGDAVATAHNIAASPLLWRLGITGDILMHVCDVPVMLILFLLLRPVSRTLALLALLFTVVQTAALVANSLNLLIALFLAGEAPFSKVMYVFLRASSYGFGIGLIFFGFTCLIAGYLIRKSDFLPWILGALMQLAGVCYLANSFLLLIAPEYANVLILLPCFIAELSLGLWLLIKGVDVQKWQQWNCAL